MKRMSEQTINAIINYLVQQPYKDVADCYRWYSRIYKLKKNLLKNNNPLACKWYMVNVNG